VAVTDANRNGSFSVAAFIHVARGKSSEVESPWRSKAQQGRTRQGKARALGFSKGSFKGRLPPSIPLGSHRESQVAQLMHCMKKKEN